VVRSGPSSARSEAESVPPRRIPWLDDGWDLQATRHAPRPRSAALRQQVHGMGATPRKATANWMCDDTWPCRWRPHRCHRLGIPHCLRSAGKPPARRRDQAATCAPTPACTSRWWRGAEAGARWLIAQRTAVAPCTRRRVDPPRWDCIAGPRPDRRRSVAFARLRSRSLSPRRWCRHDAGHARSWATPSAESTTGLNHQTHPGERSAAV
jgi:hypothetical protein